MASIFTRIIEEIFRARSSGRMMWRLPLSINPLNTGHVLVVPRDEVDHWLDLSPDVAQHLMAVSQAIGRALQDAFQPERIGLMIAGFEVPHCHVHVVPMNGMHHLDMANAASSVDPDDLEQAAGAIRSALRNQGQSQVAD
ncbi:MAG: HIT family protein [Thermomicrobiales bacterium]